VGDIEDVIRAGGWRWPLIVYAVLMIPVGLFLLERFINATPLRAVTDASWRWIAGTTAAAAATVSLALMASGWEG
jgi:hypothetical protein